MRQRRAQGSGRGWAAAPSLVLLAACIGALAACGGTSDRDQILGTIRSYTEAVDRADHGAECRLLSVHAQVKLVETVRRLQAAPELVLDRSLNPTTCAQALQVWRGSAHKAKLTAQAGAFDNLSDVHVAVHGSRADANNLSLPVLAGSVLSLVRVDGHWRLDEAEL